MKLNIKLPRIIDVGDYHQFKEVEYYYQLLTTRIKVIEAGFYNGRYIGIVYLRKDAKFKKIENMVKKWTNENRNDG